MKWYDAPSNGVHLEFPFNISRPFTSDPADRTRGLAIPARDPAVDRESFNRQMLEHLPAAHRLAIRLSGRVESAEELVQETMFRAARSWQSFQGQSKFTTWLFQILINVFRDQLKSRKHVEAIIEEPPDSSGIEPIDLASGGELGELIASAVSTLPPRQREVLVLLVYEQLRPREVASLLQISEQNVRTNLHLARSLLKKRLANYLNEDRCEPPR